MTTPEMSNLPLQKPERAAVSSASLEMMRDKILSASLYAGSIFAALIFATNIITLRNTGNWYLMYLYIPALVSVFVSAIFRKIPYQIRAYGFIFAIYTVGMASLLTYGVSGTARSWLVVFPIITAILLGIKPGVNCVIISLASWGLTGLFMNLGIVPQPSLSEIQTSASTGAWITGAAAILGLSAISAISVGILLRNLEQSNEQESLLSERLEQERKHLEESVLDRTVDLSRRLVQIRTAAEISRAISGVLEHSDLLNTVVNLVQERFELYYAGVFLLDDQKEYAVLQAGTGVAGQKMVQQGHRLPLGGTSMIGWTCENRQPRIALDVGQDAAQFNNPYLPYTRSELALPLVSGDETLGAMTVQSTLPAAFDDNDITLLQGIADSLATAIQNARLFHQVNANLEEIQALHRQYLSGAWNPKAREKVKTYEYLGKFVPQQDGKIYPIQAPIKLRGQIIGRINLDCDHDLSEYERNLIEEIGNEAAVALENARLLEEIRERSQEEHMINDLTAQLTRSLSFDILLKTTVQELGRLPNVSQVSIRMDVPKQVEP